MFYHVMHGFLLKIKTKTPGVSLNTGRFILDFVVDSSANPKGPYAINTCSTKLLLQAN